MSSPKIEVVRKFGFDAAHRLINHEGKCAWLHGHRYTVHVHLAPKLGLDPVGRVLDFAVMQRWIGGWLDEHLDHNTILHEEDGTLAAGIAKFCRGGSPFLLPYNPTAENIAKFLLDTIAGHLLKGVPVVVTRVVVEETPNCRAEVEI